MKTVTLVGVECDISHSPPTWRWSAGDHWEVTERVTDSNSVLAQEVGEQPRNASQCARRARESWHHVRDAFAGVIDLPELTSPGLLEWLAERPHQVGPATSFAVATILNELVSSETIARCEILSSVVGKHMTANLRGLPPLHPCWLFLYTESHSLWEEDIEEYVWSFPQLFFRRIDEKCACPIVDTALQQIVLSLLQSHRFLTRFSVERYEYEPERATLAIRWRLESILAPYPKGRICGCIPIPGAESKTLQYSGDEPTSVRSPEVVLGSPQMVDTLKELSGVWQDQFASSVLLLASSGSGKEALARSVAFGRGRNPERLRTISLATTDSDSLERQLLGYSRVDGSFCPGLIAQADGGALFCDEAHRGSSEVREALLRPLESREYLPIGSSSVRDVGDIPFIFSASLKWEEITKEDFGPRDFWTRMTNVIQIVHPLEIVNAGNQADALRCFFKFFWWRRTQDYFRIEPSLAVVGPQYYRISTDLTEGPRLRLSRSYMAFLLDSAKLETMATSFASVLQRDPQRPPGKISIRGLASIVSRMFSIVIVKVGTGTKFWEEAPFTEELEEIMGKMWPVVRLD